MIIDQLTAIYLSKEFWHKNKLSQKEANLYHERLLMQGNILTYVESGELKGYIEFWRINFEQWGRLVCGVPVYAYGENITDGNIAYINNMWVAQNSKSFDMLLAMFLTKNKDAQFFTAFRRSKKHQPILVYDRTDFIKCHK